jgi:hypothetical protein
MAVSESGKESEVLDRYFGSSPTAGPPSRFAIALVAVGVFLVTGFFFPVLSYISVLMFGFPASVIVLGGYI